MAPCSSSSSPAPQAPPAGAASPVPLRSAPPSASRLNGSSDPAHPAPCQAVVSCLVALAIPYCGLCFPAPNRTPCRPGKHGLAFAPPTTVLVVAGNPRQQPTPWTLTAKPSPSTNAMASDLAGSCGPSPRQVPRLVAPSPARRSSAPGAARSSLLRTGEQAHEQRSR
ncbi:lysine-rich arabinogalactan protein 18-like [Triticum aestivum]|uniref:lysine-rich arabinogalactan protein 18-like n=1 Tax=Triticum aestivum TaxID=4565 RepID=UPI001D0068D7|nr:lysine-rich arabinogalactan protein 18-like [Triticum aestivum]